MLNKSRMKCLKKIYTRFLVNLLNKNFSKLSILTSNIELFKSHIEGLYRRFPFVFYDSIYELKKTGNVKYYEESKVDFESRDDQKYVFFNSKNVNYLAIDENYYPLGDAQDLVEEIFEYESMLEDNLQMIEKLNGCFEDSMQKLESLNIDAFNDRSEVFSNYWELIAKAFDNGENICFGIVNKMLQEIIDSSKEIVDKGERIDISQYTLY